MVRDSSLLNLDLLDGFVVSPVNSICHYFRTQIKYLDLFTTKVLN